MGGLGGGLIPRPLSNNQLKHPMFVLSSNQWGWPLDRGGVDPRLAKNWPQMRGVWLFSDFFYHLWLFFGHFWPFFVFLTVFWANVLASNCRLFNTILHTYINLNHFGQLVTIFFWSYWPFSRHCFLEMKCFHFWHIFEIQHFVFGIFACWFIVLPPPCPTTRLFQRPSPRSDAIF